MQKGLRFQFAVLSNILFLAYYLLLFVSRHFFFTAAIGGHETMGRDPTMGTRNVQDRSPSLCLMN